MSDYERQLLARARELADVGELAETVAGILGGGRRAGLDPDALGGLVGAATALGIDGVTVYAAGRGPGTRYADEGEFLGALADAEDDIAERLKAAGHLHDQVVTAMDSALGALDAALAMHTSDPCDGCHGRKAAAIAEAEARVRLCGDAIEILEPLGGKLRHALDRIRAVPSDLGETYASIYTLVRRGGAMPHQGRWITGQEAKVAPTPGTPLLVVTIDEIDAVAGDPECKALLAKIASKCRGGSLDRKQ